MDTIQITIITHRASVSSRKSSPMIFAPMSPLRRCSSANAWTGFSLLGVAVVRKLSCALVRLGPRTLYACTAQWYRVSGSRPLTWIQARVELLSNCGLSRCTMSSSDWFLSETLLPNDQILTRKCVACPPLNCTVHCSVRPLWLMLLPVKFVGASGMAGTSMKWALLL